jgi:hypothetical protein
MDCCAHIRHMCHIPLRITGCKTLSTLTRNYHPEKHVSSIDFLIVVRYRELGLELELLLNFLHENENLKLFAEGELNKSRTKGLKL